MSFQAYLDAVETRTGLPPRRLVAVHAITKGEQIGDEHVGSSGVHRDPKDHLWLDGVTTKPDGY